MAMTIHVDIVSAEREIFSGSAEMVFAPAQRGEVGIAPRHAPLLSPLKPGTVRIKLAGGGEESFYVSGGILEVQPHVVTVLSDTALRGEDIDEQLALEAKQRAEAAIKGEQTELSYTEAHAQLAEALAQLEMVRQMKKLRGHK
ncbi:MAG TPA: F0F1 ATP synthase subunit epsilon [Gammaproteobacteria bacterium]